MDKVQIVYWSATGNTEEMANAIAQGVSQAGAVAEVISVENANKEELLAANAFALGCPAMGDEELEDADMEPFVASLEGSLAGKQILLFGSYDWGDGEWMRLWAERMQSAGATIIGGEGIIANNEPDEEAKERCKEAGAKLAQL